MLINDTFPKPSLNPLNWTALQQGTVALFVGTPTDGVYPHGVDTPGDSVEVSSESKINIPAGTPFEQWIHYGDVYTDPEQAIIYYLGWRSALKSGGISVWGVDVLLAARPGNEFVFQKRVINSGVEVRNTIKSDPALGANSQFKMVRVGSTYSLYYYDGGWVHLEDVVLPYSGIGYVHFGVYAEDPLIVFPWIFQT